jgi:hypothetical protein
MTALLLSDLRRRPLCGTQSNHRALQRVTSVATERLMTVRASPFSVRVEETPVVLRHDIEGEGRGLFESVTQYNECA